MITRLLLLLSLLCWPLAAEAQLRPGSFSILTTTDTGNDSARVGCASLTVPVPCVGGINAGYVVFHRDVSGFSDTLAQIIIQAARDTDEVLAIGYNSFINQSYIQSNWRGHAPTALNLQPNGGNVIIPVGGFLQCTGCVVNADLDTTGVTASAYGDFTHFPVLTINAQGRITAAVNTLFTGVTSLPQLAATTNTFTGALLWSTTAVMSWNSKTVGTTYQAASDGFVSATADCSGGGGCTGHVNLISDSGAAPATLRSTAWAIDGVAASAMIPIKKNDYYKVVSTTGGGAPVFTMWWIPLGTGG